ncbi:MAG: GNAT family N-acetyltransferase [Desulfobacterales bacterium]|nr:GNAT family N-acetyltransferase [Desulfobacterales bacterium]
MIKSESMKPHFEIADLKDAPKLTLISIEAFHTDDTVAGRNSKGGPPGYDSIAFHEQMIQESTKFFTIKVDKKIVGGFWFNQENLENAYLYRVFLDPEFHRKGIGLQAFLFLFENFPDIKVWTLKVPTWNTRTPKFYKKLGFKIVDKSDRFLLFKRTWCK